MKLIKPNLKYEQSWQEALAEFRAEKAIGFWNFEQEPTNITEYIQRTKNESVGKNLKSNKSPNSTYWLIDKNKFIGHCNIRHSLTEQNQQFGHIGYYIRPAERQKGYGTKILELAIVKLKQLNLSEALITCDETNQGSIKVIQKNRGQLLKKFKLGENNALMFRLGVEE